MYLYGPYTGRWLHRLTRESRTNQIGQVPCCKVVIMAQYRVAAGESDATEINAYPDNNDNKLSFEAPNSFG